MYSKATEYILVLQYLLQHFLSLSGKASKPAKPLLSDKSVQSIFTGTLAISALPSFAEFYTGYLQLEGEDALEAGEGDWSTAFAIYNPKDGKRRGGWGREAGSGGWGGAAGTEYWVDPKTGIAVSWRLSVIDVG